MDRDGTLIDFYRDVSLGVVTPAFHPDHVRLMPGVHQGLRRFMEHGFVLAIATNQPGAAKGQISRDAIHRTNAHLLDRLRAEGIAIERFEACLHHPEGGEGGAVDLIQDCECRKPLGGMLNTIAQALDLDRTQSWMVGDTAADLGAAHAAGFRSGLLSEPGRCELCPIRPAAANAPLSAQLWPEVRAGDLSALADQICGLRPPSRGQ